MNSKRYFSNSIENLDIEQVFWKYNLHLGIIYFNKEYTITQGSKKGYNLHNYK